MLPLPRALWGKAKVSKCQRPGLNPLWMPGLAG